MRSNSPTSHILDLEYTLSRARPKELAHDYLDLDSAAKVPLEAERDLRDSPEAIQAQARQAWAAFRAKDLQSGVSPQDIQRLARERWQAYRQGQDADRGGPNENKLSTQEQDRIQGKDDGQSL